MALASKLIKGSTVSLLEHGLKIGLMFVVTPLMIHHLGEKDYGIWLLALAIVSYLKLLDLGLSFSGSRFLGRAIGAENAESYESLITTLTWLFQRIGLISLVITGLIWLVLPHWLTEPETLNAVRWLILGFGFSTAVNFWIAIFEISLKSHVRYDLIGLASLIRTILQGGLIIFTLLSGHGLTTLIFVFIGTDLIYRGLLIGFARHVSPDSRIPLFRAHREEKIKPLLKYSATAMAASAGQSLRNGIDPMIIAHVATVAAVPVYAIGARFLSLFTDIINAIFGGNFVAAFSQIHGRDDPKHLEKSFLTSIRFCSAIATLGGCALLIYGPDFIERWVGPSFANSATVLLILTPPTVLALMQYPIWGFFYSQNKQHWLAYVMLGGGIVNVGLSLFLASLMGFFGVVWATLIEMTIAFGILVPVMVVKIFGIPCIDYLKATGSSFLKIAAGSVTFYLLAGKWLAPDYLRLAVLGAGHLVVVVPIIWFLVFTKEERTRFTEAMPFLRPS